MPSYVVCECCGRRIPATPTDINRAVVCPTSRRLVLVTAGNLQDDPRPDRASSSRIGRRVAAGVLALATLGIAGYLLRNQFDRPHEEVKAEGVTAPDKKAQPGPEVELVERKTNPPASSEKAAPPDPDSAGPTPRGLAVAPPPRLVVSAAPGAFAATQSPRPSAPSQSTTVATAPAPTTQAPVPGSASNPTGVLRNDALGMTTHRLARRIDLRSEEDLQKELLRVREVSLDTPTAPQTSTTLFQLGVGRLAAGLPYPGPAVAARKRDDLAGLPFRLGPDAVLFKTRAEALDALSKRLRSEVQACIPADGTDPRPDPDKLYAALLSGSRGLFRDKKWAAAEAVPCIQQMLQAEGKAVRRMSVELLRGIDGEAATDALVRWSVFDPDAENRAAAVDALKSRDKAAVAALLLAHLRYPWPRASEHAAEALVALNCRAAVPDLAALLTLPDPDAPQTPALPGSKTPFRREMVRVNHVRNCLLCHPPSPTQADLVRGAIPDPTRPLPAAATPAYYSGTGRFVHASTTYVKQDFSVVQPVPSPGLWPGQQRYDYLVAVRPVTVGEVGTAGAVSAYRDAVLFALRELTGRDLGATAEAWAGLRAGKAAPDDSLSYEAGRYLTLLANPEALILFTLQEFSQSFLSLTASERAVVLARFRRQYGATATRYAVVTYLEWLARTGDPSVRQKALQLLATVRGEAGEADPPVDPAVAAGLLAHSNSRIRTLAAGELGTLGAAAKKHYKDLLKALADPEAEVRKAAAEALGNIPSSPDDVYDALAKATRDPVGGVRVASAGALARLKYVPKSAARPLAEGLVQKGKWDRPADQAAFEKLCAELLGEMRSRSTPGYSVVLNAASGEVPTDVPAATLAKLLADTGPPAKDQLKALVPLLLRPEYKAVASGQLFAAGDDAIPVLIAALKDDRPKLRAAVAELLGRAASLNRDPAVTRASWRATLDALAPLKTMDPSTDVKEAAAAALTKLTASP